LLLLGSDIPGRVEISEKLLEYDAYVQDRSKVMGFVFSEGVYKAETLQSLKVSLSLLYLLLLLLLLLSLSLLLLLDNIYSLWF
jgi:hypothetical protein